MVALPTHPRDPLADNADMDSDTESTTSASTFLTSTSTTSTFFPTPAPTVTTSTPTPTNPSPPLLRRATPTPGQTYHLLHVPSQRVLSLLHGIPTLVPPLTPLPSPHPAQQAQAQREREETLGCPNWTLVTSHGYLGLRNCASATFLGRDLPGRIVAGARGHGSWEAFVAVPVASVRGDGVDYEGGGDGDGYYVLMCINFVAGCLERVGVRTGEGEGDGLGVLLEGLGEGAVWEFVGVGVRGG